MKFRQKMLRFWLGLFCQVQVGSGAVLSIQEAAAISSTATTTVEPPPTNLTCKNESCGILSYSYIRFMFKGLLHTMKEIQDLEKVANQNKDSYYSSQGFVQTANIMEPEAYVDDGGTCCSTSVRHISNTTLRNIFGDEKSIIHLADGDPPSYQYIPHASCVKKGNCAGTCLIEPKIMSLLVLDKDQGYKFDIFEIPGYCSCKNVYRR